MHGYPVFEALKKSLNIISQRRTDRQMLEAEQEFLLGLEATKAGWTTTRHENIQKMRTKATADLAETKYKREKEDRILSLPDITSQWFTGKTQELGREPTWDETPTWHKYTRGYRPQAPGTTPPSKPPLTAKQLLGMAEGELTPMGFEPPEHQEALQEAAIAKGIEMYPELAELFRAFASSTAAAPEAGGGGIGGIRDWFVRLFGGDGGGEGEKSQMTEEEKRLYENYNTTIPERP